MNQSRSHSIQGVSPHAEPSSPGARRLLLLSLLLVGFATTGCIQLRMDLNMAPDGSVASHIHIEMLEQMYQMVLGTASQPGETIPLFDEEELKSYLADNNGKLRSYSNKSEDGFRVIDMRIFAKDAPSFVNRAGGDFMALEKTEGVWRWTFLDNEMTRTYREMEDALLENQLEMLKASFSGMDVQLALTVPELTDTNLEKVDGTKVRYTLNFDEEIGIASGPEAVEKFRGLLLPKWVAFKGFGKK
ncbi:hypothetical protein SCOR_13135 [Sulfidibacter corallicola]|uniref:Uncharacterized protein n=1 Tax=Sulfidibacter corallicola TaxID=2818388 RepID=A0A8A4TC98_SULCO|nr:hypothetical protein [Sulfidibacter corallicola]QTD47729.1 hypothetical protein J3U87_19240 [Sulfidibacter corallicola]